ncbi:MAG: hypothetical protein AAFR96_12395 [Planctomycetota bacterium]
MTSRVTPRSTPAAAALLPLMLATTASAGNTTGADAPRSLLDPMAPIIAPAVPHAPSAAFPQILGSPSVADDTFVKVRGGGWILFQSGSVVVGDDSGGGATTVLDLRDTLNQDESDVSPIGSVAVAIPAIDIIIEAGFLGSYRYDGTTTESISFDGTTYTGTVATETNYSIYELNALYELAEVSIFKIHLGGGVRLFDVEAEIAGTVGGAPDSENESLFLPIPVAAVGARADLGPNFFLQGRLSGIYLGEFGSVIDGSLEAGWDFMRNAGIFAGYRVINAESESFDVEVDLTLGGPYAGIELRI